MGLPVRINHTDQSTHRESTSVGPARVCIQIPVSLQALFPVCEVRQSLSLCISGSFPIRFLYRGDIGGWVPAQESAPSRS